MQVSHAQWVDTDHTCFNVIVSSDEFENLPYSVCLNSDDEAPVHRQLVEMYNNGQIDVAECDESLLESIKCSDVRCTRDSLLLDTDKFMTVDYPISDEDRNALRTYRQALRNIPQQEGFPDNVVWPEKPSCLG